MTQKHVVILLIILALIGVGGAGISSLQNTVTQNLEAGISPTPTPGELLFNSGSNRSDIQRSGQVQGIGEEENIGNSPELQPGAKKAKQYQKFPGVLPAEQLQSKKAVIETAKGKIEFEIYPDASKAASNFIFLAKDGFYNGLTFHRVEKGFVIQGGDPKGDGTGGPGYNFEDEPVTKSYDKGIVAMANAGPNTNGSQFFIMLADRDLPPQYTIFGKVISGMDVVEQIQVGDVMEKVFILPQTPGGP